jgi:predicted  nucleic acid-binding Zn-ribbon protein
MSDLAPLLELQDVDLACDAARARSANLPERALLPAIEARLAEIEAAIAAARSERASQKGEEERIAREVGEVAKAIEAAELERYSGGRKNKDQAAAHDESQTRLREKQASLEEQELELLESIEAVEARIAEQQSVYAAHRAESERARELFEKVEGEVAAELERLGLLRASIVPRIPNLLVTAYERVRIQPRKGGRGAAVLEGSQCGGCRIKLPSLEKTRMMAEPEDALIQCPQCRRVLIR